MALERNGLTATHLEPGGIVQWLLPQGVINRWTAAGAGESTARPD